MEPNPIDGVIKWWRPNKGTGAVSSASLPPGKDAWLHLARIEGGDINKLIVGTRLRFTYNRESHGPFEYVVDAAWLQENGG